VNLELQYEARKAELAAEVAAIEGGPLAIELQKRLRAEADLAMMRIDLQISQAVERDQLQAERPEGCVCLGVGGTGHLLPGVRHLLWSTWCVCPESLELQETARAIDRDMRREQVEQRAADQAAELAERMQRANLPKRLDQSGLTLGSFDGDAGKGAAVEAIRMLRTGSQPGGLYLFGPVGTGKSTLAALAARGWVEQGGTAFFVPVAHLLDMLRPGGQEMAEDVAESQAALKTRLTNVGLLVLDDIGAERVTGWSRERLLVVINTRYDELRPTIYTSNWDLDAMSHRLSGGDDEIEGDRIAWRIKQSCDLVLVGGRNYRAGPPTRPLSEARV
jgi:DNA replication protein DnaC/primosomal protein DnaI